MRLVKIKCLECGAKLEVNKDLDSVVCNYCGNVFFIDDNIKRIEVKKYNIYTDEAKIKQEERKLKELELKEKEERGFHRFYILFFLILGLISFLYFLFDDSVTVPSSARAYKGDNYKIVVKELRNAGFENIDTEPVYDLIFGIVNGEFEIEKISIEGVDDFKKGDTFSKDSPIVITYHAFKKKEEK